MTNKKKINNKKKKIRVQLVNGFLYYLLIQLIRNYFINFTRCTKSGIKQITCPSGLAFDIDKQTCDWRAKVTNCDKLDSKLILGGKGCKEKMRDSQIDSRFCSIGEGSKYFCKN